MQSCTTPLLRSANGMSGILIEAGASNNIIGGTVAGSGNVISGNLADGIEIRDATTAGNAVMANMIGTDTTGTASLGNAGSGVHIHLDATGSVIGGIYSGTGNTIANNGGAGVLVEGTAATGHAIAGNAIFNNAGLGIDLGNDGVTANDPLDTDTGVNDLQNTPVLSTVSVFGGSTTITGTMDGLPSTTYRIEFFSSPTADPSGSGAEGDIASDVEMREQPVVLEDHPDRTVFRRDEDLCVDVVQRYAVEADRPGRQRGQAADGPQRRCLAGAIGTEEPGDPARGQVEREVQSEGAALHLAVDDEPGRPPLGGPVRGVQALSTRRHIGASALGARWQLGAHTAPPLGSQRSRSAARTATDTTSSTRAKAIAAPGSDSIARYTAIGMVWVRPGKLPAKVIVAPNSPRARAHDSTAPAASDGATRGRVTRRNVVHRDAPSPAATCS